MTQTTKPNNNTGANKPRKPKKNIGTSPVVATAVEKVAGKTVVSFTKEKTKNDAPKGKKPFKKRGGNKPPVNKAQPKIETLTLRNVVVNNAKGTITKVVTVDKAKHKPLKTVYVIGETEYKSFKEAQTALDNPPVPVEAEVTPAA